MADVKTTATATIIDNISSVYGSSVARYMACSCL